MVPHGDEQWFDVVKTVMSILVYGEAYGVASGNLPSASTGNLPSASTGNLPSASTGNTKVDRLLGFEGSYGQESLGINQTAAQDVIRAVGNYGEIYDPQPGSRGHQPAQGKRPQRAMGRRNLRRLPQGRPNLRGAPAIAHLRP